MKQEFIKSSAKGIGFAITFFALLSMFPPVKIEVVEIRIPEKTIEIVRDTICPYSKPQVVQINQKPTLLPEPKGAQKRYIDRFSGLAITEMEKYGIPASISLAQGLLESAAGTSYLAINNNNHFGVKCFAKNCPKGHCTNRKDDSHKDFFRKYESPWESWRAHSQLLCGKRYRYLKKHGKKYQAWAKGLQESGYATSPTYAKDLIRLIEKLGLYKYDYLN